MTNNEWADLAGQVREDGEDVILISVTVGAYNTATGSATPVEVNITRKAVQIPIKNEDKIINGALVTMGSRRLMLDNGTTTPAIKPAMNDKIIFDGFTYEILGVSTQRAGGGDIYHDLHISR